MVRVSGFVAKPETARKKGARQYFFVNGRYMRHPYFHKAIMDAYEQLVPVGEQVSYFIYFEVDPANIDVNIHPTKTEIKFENEQAIWQILSAAVKESLGKFNAPFLPLILIRRECRIFQPLMHLHTLVYSHQRRLIILIIILLMFRLLLSSSYSKPSKDWEQLYAGLERHASSQNFHPDENDYRAEETSPAEENPGLYDHVEDSSVSEKSGQHYQFKGRFILTSVKSGLMIIDQQRAHIRILYDKYIDQISRRQGISQGMLFPDIVQFPLSEVAILQEIMEDLSFLGFELTDLGGGSYAINGVPAGIEGLNPIDLIQNMVHTAMEKGGKVKEEVQSILALTLAKATAIVPGEALTNEEMTGLVDGLFAVNTPNYTPDGKTVSSVINEDDLEKLFK